MATSKMMTSAEWVPEQGIDKLPGAGYLPPGLDQLSRLWKAPLQFYQLPWASQSAPVSQQAPGYVFSGALGVGFLIGATRLLAKWLARRDRSEARSND